MKEKDVELEKVFWNEWIRALQSVWTHGKFGLRKTKKNSDRVCIRPEETSNI